MIITKRTALLTQTYTRGTPPKTEKHSLWLTDDEVFYNLLVDNGVTPKEKSPLTIPAGVFEKIAVEYFLSLAGNNHDIVTIRTMLASHQDVVYELFETKELKPDDMLQEGKQSISDLLWSEEMTVEAIQEKLALIEPLVNAKIEEKQRQSMESNVVQSS